MISKTDYLLAAVVFIPGADTYSPTLHELQYSEGLVKVIPDALALGILFSLINVGSAFAA